MQLVGQNSGSEKPLKFGFVGFYQTFNPVYNHITLALRDKFPIVVMDVDKDELPDFLFFSVFGNKHLNPRFAGCTKIFLTEENIRPPWEECDFAMTGDRLPMPDERHLRLPIYERCIRFLKGGRTLIKPAGLNPREVLARKNKFCNFVYSNPAAKERLLFFKILARYKPVDSGGALCNNMGGRRVADKMTFLDDYKFTIAFENSRFPGYVSEKIVEPMAANSIPIYWGCRDIALDFNPRSFVHANEPVGSNQTELEHHFEHVIHRIVWLDTHDDDYCAMVSEPWFHGNRPNQYCEPDYIHDFMRNVFAYHAHKEAK
jgi:hypothetical protein